MRCCGGCRFACSTLPLLVGSWLGWRDALTGKISYSEGEHGAFVRFHARCVLGLLFLRECAKMHRRTFFALQPPLALRCACARDEQDRAHMCTCGAKRDAPGLIFVRESGQRSGGGWRVAHARSRRGTVERAWALSCFQVLIHTHIYVWLERGDEQARRSRAR